MLKKTFILFVAATFLLAACNSTKPMATNSTGFLWKSTPGWAKDAVIYEVNVRQFSREGTFRAFMDDLPRIKSMNVDILWLMPIFPISKTKTKGSIGSHYSVLDYKATNPAYGSMDDFKALVQESHKLGMKVILDWVPNHTGWDHAWIKQHPDWYTQVNGEITDPLDEKTGKSVGWTDVADLNYDNKEMRKAMIEALQFWVQETDIDGYRMDVAGFVPDDFWKSVRPALEKVKPEVFLLSEWEKPEHFQTGFDMCYGWAFHALMKEIYKGDKKAADVEAYFTKERAEYRKGYIKMHFTNNHDENSWNGTTKELFGGDNGDAIKTFAVLCSTIDGMPLIYNGQESELDKRLAFFDKDQIDWRGYPLAAFYTKLFKLKKDNEALWNGNFGGLARFLKTDNPNALAFVREKNGNQLLFVFNLSNKKQEVTLNDAEIKNIYEEVFTGGGRDLINYPSKWSLNPWGYKVYVRTGM